MGRSLYSFLSLFLHLGVFCAWPGGLISKVQGRDLKAKNSLCDVKHFTQKLDHFSFARNDTFRQRYVICQEHWSSGGPLLFYTGNEGDIMLFVNNTGFLFEMAPQLNAMIVFAEHRYYGQSIPFDGKTLNSTTLPWLTSTQALADYNYIIHHLKRTIPGLKQSPVVAVGGSYGGMLAAWMRMKYPATVIGALSSSAPILQFGNQIPCNTFAKIATQDYKMASPVCVDTIRRSWTIMEDFWKDQAGRDWLKDNFRVCQILDDRKVKLADFRLWLFSGWTYMAMTDYPYPTEFLKPMPGWPVKAACQHLSDLCSFKTDRDLLIAVYKGISVYYNYTGQVKDCFNISDSSTGTALGDTQWDYQACSELVMPDCTDGKTDMFYYRPWNISEYNRECHKNFAVKPDPSLAIREYGGRDLVAHSNIIFSNGKLDPWSGGGVIKAPSKRIKVILIDDAAHHLDLRSSHPDDPQSVVYARKKEIAIIKKWIITATNSAEYL
ncbi:Lysosomal Pro-X carboxypeptidase [Hypsibius exemplaris]|uniref:Lysosomal Pro-X carboxypeptidase n=1 Tax=Hypsibius exemplaris TaxID=2072580 RepID=A0A1W0X5V1_HYPEX|nr:Lysosomal Pro-X carboxypeptidase [Hypsibius exemplaris]